MLRKRFFFRQGGIPDPREVVTGFFGGGTGLWRWQVFGVGFMKQRYSKPPLSLKFGWPRGVHNYFWSLIWVYVGCDVMYRLRICCFINVLFFVFSFFFYFYIFLFGLRFVLIFFMCFYVMLIFNVLYFVYMYFLIFHMF